MKLRTQLIVAFLLVSVVPLTAVILYSYLTSERAFRKVVEAEAGVLAEEMGKRMEAVTGELRRRIDRLASLPFRKMMAKNRRDSDLGPVAGGYGGGRRPGGITRVHPCATASSRPRLATRAASSRDELECIL